LSTSAATPPANPPFAVFDAVAVLVPLTVVVPHFVEGEDATVCVQVIAALVEVDFALTSAPAAVTPIVLCTELAGLAFAVFLPYFTSRLTFWVLVSAVFVLTFTPVSTPLLASNWLKLVVVVLVWLFVPVPLKVGLDAVVEKPLSSVMTPAWALVDTTKSAI
jgi:hypothetical protein